MASELNVGGITTTGNVGIGGAVSGDDLLTVGDGTATNGAGIRIYSKRPMLRLFEQDTTNNNWQLEAQAGVLIISTQNDTFSSTSNKLTISNTGLSTFSAGIALGNVASATATTLDGYKEGTFTVTTDSDATGVLLGETGEYTRIGNCVYIRIALDVNTTFTGNALGGLPFQVAHTVGASSWGTIGSVLKSSTSDLVMAAVQNGTSVVKLWASGNVNSAYAPNTSDRYYRFSGFYYTTDAF
jgi:hypothetical protein